MGKVQNRLAILDLTKGIIQSFLKWDIYEQDGKYKRNKYNNSKYGITIHIFDTTKTI